MITDRKVLNREYKYLTKLNNGIKNNKLPRGHKYYNCFSFVAHTFGWEEKPIWTSEKAIVGYLKNNTIIIKKKEAKEGDIVEFVHRPTNTPDHVAIITDVYLNRIIHKPGSFPLELNTIENAMQEYHTTKVRYRRAK
jgi:hypothetical protein